MNYVNDVNDVKMVNDVNNEFLSNGELIWETFFSQLLYIMYIMYILYILYIQ